MDRCREMINPGIKEEGDYSVFIAESILDAMEAKSMTKQQFAFLVGEPLSEIDSWLCGTYSFDYATIRKIETVLGDLPKRK